MPIWLNLCARLIPAVAQQTFVDIATTTPRHSRTDWASRASRASWASWAPRRLWQASARPHKHGAALLAINLITSRQIIAADVCPFAALGSALLCADLRCWRRRRANCRPACACQVQFRATWLKTKTRIAIKSIGFGPIWRLNSSLDCRLQIGIHRASRGCLCMRAACSRKLAS